MTNQIEPYSMIQKTNIKEHNDMINKINEIVDVINNTNLDTINTEISGLKAKATATDTEIANIKDKDTTQDTEINGITKSLVSNVTATFDNPSRELKISLGREASPSIDATVVIPASSETGQYSAGNGITIDNYQIAVDTNVVALKTDIPVVPDVSELTQRVNTLETEMPTKVNIAQGVENAGKVLGIGSDGNVTPVDGGGSAGGGEIWEEVDLVNFPSDWTENDEIIVYLNINPFPNSLTTPQSWTQSFTATGFKMEAGTGIIQEGLRFSLSGYSTHTVLNVSNTSAHTLIISQRKYTEWNTGTLFNLDMAWFNGACCNFINGAPISKDNASTTIYKLYRLRK